MQKTRMANILALLLLLCSNVVGLLTIRPIVSDAAKDITDRISITGVKVEKNNSTEVTEENPIYVSDTVHLKYFWEVTKENMVGIEPGDSFTLSLPDSEYFGGYVDKGPYDLENPHGGDSLGTYQLIGNRFHVVLNEKGAQQEMLKDGWLSIDVKALKAGTGIDGGGNGSASIPKLTIVEGEGGGGNGEDDEDFPEDQMPFRKNGKQNFGQNSINWSFVVNNQGLNELITTYSANKASGQTLRMTPKKNALLIDKLGPGMKFQAGSLYVTPTVQTINSNGNMGTRTVKNTNNLRVQDEFEQVPQMPGETLDRFMDRVQNYPTAQGKRAYGVYTNHEGRDTVLIAFGDLPGKHALYKNVHNGAIPAAIASDDTLSNTQKQDLQTIYCDPLNSPGEGGIVAYGLSFDVDVQVKDGYADGVYENKAQFIWDGGGSEEDSWETEFQRIGGGVTGEFIQAEKIVEGTGKLAKPRYFEFELVDKEAPDIPVAYGRTEKEVSQKGEKVDVDFYHEKDAQGNYSHEIVGNEAPNGWKGVLQDGHSYLLREVSNSGYSETITNGTGEGDQYDYNAKINKYTQFFIINHSAIDLQAKKKVTGTADLAEPTDYHFQLKKDGVPVAYGKTTVSQKDTECPIDFYTSEGCESANKIKDWQSILKEGESYTIEEIDSKGCTPSYSCCDDDSGQFTSGNTIKVSSGKCMSYQFSVNNQRQKPGSIEVDLQAKKMLEGRELTDDEFDFELYDADGKLVETKTNKGGTIDFTKLSFDQAGTYVYTIKEKVGTEKGMTYDEKTVTATIEITENGSQLESKVTYSDDDEKENIANEFKNYFEKTNPIEVDLQAKKTLEGRELTDDEFDFELYDSDGKLIETKTNKGKTIDFTKLSFDQVGTYTYTIKEKVGTEKGITYDEKTVTATIEIKETGNQLESKVTYSDDDEKENTANEFNNVFEEIPPLGSFRIRKVDTENNEPLKNAVFHVFDEKNQRIKADEVVKTGENGIVTVTDLPYGTYYAVEAEAPQGYLLEDEPMKVTIDEQSHEENSIVTNRNPKVKKGVLLTKIDSATGEKLPGAEFELRDAQGRVMNLRKN